MNNHLLALSTALASIGGKIDEIEKELSLLKGDKAGGGDAIATASAKIVMEAKIAAADTVSEALAEADPRVRSLECRVAALEAAAAAAPEAEPQAAAPKAASGKARKG